MEQVVQEFLRLTDSGAKPLALQKIYSSPLLISLTLRGPGKTHYMIIGRGNESQGVAFTDRQISSHHRVQDRFLQFLRHNLKGLVLDWVSSPAPNMILIEGKQKKIKVYWAFIWKDKKLFFSTCKKNNESCKVFYSWFAKWDDIKNKETWLNTLAPLQKMNWNEQSVSLLQDEKNNEGELRKREKFLKRKIANIEKDLNSAKSWTVLEEKVLEFQLNPSLLSDLIMVDLGHTKLRLPNTTVYKKIDFMFKKVRSYRNAVSFIQGRLDETKKILEEYRGNTSGEIVQNKRKIVQPVWSLNARDEITKSVNKSGEYIVLKSTIEGLSFGMGKSERGNQELRTMWAKSNDLWFHYEDRPSMHLIVKGVEALGLNEASLRAIASLMMEYDSSKPSEARVIYTQVKNLKAIKGKVGAVTYKNIRYFKSVFDSNWREILSIIK